MPVFYDILTANYDRKELHSLIMEKEDMQFNHIKASLPATDICHIKSAHVFWNLENGKRTRTSLRIPSQFRFRVHIW